MKKATITAALPLQGGKYKNNSRIISTVKGIFSSGRKVTAKDLNQITGSNDARKQISTLRKEGWRIVDQVQPGGHKLYWLASDDRQYNIFREGGKV